MWYVYQISILKFDDDCWWSLLILISILNIWSMYGLFLCVCVNYYNQKQMFWYSTEEKCSITGEFNIFINNKCDQVYTCINWCLSNRCLNTTWSSIMLLSFFFFLNFIISSLHHSVCVLVSDMVLNIQYVYPPIRPSIHSFNLLCIQTAASLYFFYRIDHHHHYYHDYQQVPSPQVFFLL